MVVLRMGERCGLTIGLKGAPRRRNGCNPGATGAGSFTRTVGHEPMAALHKSEVTLRICGDTRSRIRFPDFWAVNRASRSLRATLCLQGESL